MIPFASTLAAADQDVIYVAGYFYPYPGGTIAPSFMEMGASAGDFAIYVSLNTGGSLNQPGWTELGSDGAFYHFYRVLSVADLSIRQDGPAGTMLLIYRGPIVSYAKLGFRGGGFIKHRAHAGIVAVGYTNADSNTQPPLANLTPPTFIRRLFDNTRTTPIAAHDRLSPPNQLYVDNTPFTVTNGSISIIELRSE